MKKTPVILLALCFIACNKQKKECISTPVNQATLTGKFSQAGSIRAATPRQTISNCKVHFYADSFAMEQHVVLDEAKPGSCLTQSYIEYIKGKWSVKDWDLKLQGAYTKIPNGQNGNTCIDTGKININYGINMCDDTLIIHPPSPNATAMEYGIKLYKSQ